jgi:thiol-disulfide isomerase/thioredoxin
VHYVIVALVSLSALVLFNLAVSVVLARRVNQLRRQGPGMRLPPAGRALLPVGTVVSDFAATTVDGTPVSRTSLADPSLVVFLAPGCQPCRDLLPVLAARAQAFGGPDRVLAVLAANDGGEPTEYLRLLSGAARVVLETDHGVLSEAFRAVGYPVAYLVGAGGRILAAGAGATALDELRAAAESSHGTVGASVG